LIFPLDASANFGMGVAFICFGSILTVVLLPVSTTAVFNYSGAGLIICCYEVDAPQPIVN